MIRLNWFQAFLITLTVAFVLTSMNTRAVACSAFKYTKVNEQDGTTRTFVGNNEDWNKDNPTIMFYPPKKKIGKTEYGRMYISYWYYFFWMPFAGVNEHGLMYDIFVVHDTPSIPTNFRNTLAVSIDLATKAMKTCKNVDDVVKLFEKHNIFSPQHQLLFTDKQGNSVVIEGNGYVRQTIKDGDLSSDKYQVVTNHTLVESHQVKDEDAFTEDSKRRHAMITEALEALDSDDPEQFSVKHFASICESVSVPFLEHDHPTQYSYVIDLNNMTMYLFRGVNNERVDYENAAVLDISDTLNSIGKKRSIKLNDLEFAPYGEDNTGSE